MTKNKEKSQKEKKHSRKKIPFSKTRSLSSWNRHKNNFFKFRKKQFSQKNTLFGTIIKYLVALLLSIGSIALKSWLDPFLGVTAPFLLAFTPVLISAWIGGLGPGILATCIADAGVFNFFFLPSYEKEKIEILFQASIFFLEGVIISALLEVGKRANILVKSRVSQQAAIADIGQSALASSDISQLFKHTLFSISQSLSVNYCKILQFLPEKNKFILRAGIGWQPGLVGHAIVNAGKNSQAGFALLTDQPVLVKDLKKDTRFHEYGFLLKHQVVSGMSVLIPGKPDPFGVLSVYTKKHRTFTQDDIYFLQAVANILTTAIDRKNFEEVLQENQLRFKRLTESNIIGIITEDNSGILDTNDTFLNMVGFSRKDIRKGKMHLRSITPHEYQLLDKKTKDELKKYGSCRPFEKELTRKDGSRVSVMIGTTAMDKQASTWLSFILDITKQKELERRKDEFISIASHELKTPITSLKVFTQLLQRRFTERKDRQALSYLIKMDNQIDKLTNLVGDLLDITKIQTGKLQFHMENTDMSSLIKEIVDTMRSTTTTHTISIKHVMKGYMFIDGDRIGQVIINLISNAVKYSPKGGNIEINFVKKKNQAIFSIEDNGIGIPKNQQENIFQRFYRISEESEKKFPGLGIGLYISSEIIKRHSGTIWVESKEGKGSTFYFSLPLQQKSNTVTHIKQLTAYPTFS